MIWIPDLHYMEFISHLIELLLQRILDNNITRISMSEVNTGCAFGLDPALLRLSRKICQC